MKKAVENLKIKIERLLDVEDLNEHTRKHENVRARSWFFNCLYVELNLSDRELKEYTYLKGCAIRHSRVKLDEHLANFKCLNKIYKENNRRLILELREDLLLDESDIESINPLVLENLQLKKQLARQNELFELLVGLKDSEFKDLTEFRIKPFLKSINFESKKIDSTIKSVFSGQSKLQLLR